jgi:AbiTii
MTGLVEEIQAQAIDRHASVANLLRKVKLAAVKLKLEAAVEWVEQELNGYASAADVPDYRVIRGSIFSHSPYHGQVAISGDPKTIIMLSTQKLCEPIASLEDLVVDKAGGSLMIKLDERITHQINEWNGGRHFPIYVHFTSSVIVSIVDRVRNMVLDWAVTLEQQGIFGEGITFTMAEKEKAAAAGMTINIGTLSGGFHHANVTGDGNTTSVTSDQSIHTNHGLLNDLSSTIESNVTEAADKQAMLTLVEQMKEAQGTPEFRLPFSGLMEHAANYITVLGPFLPALTKMLPA